MKKRRGTIHRIGPAQEIVRELANTYAFIDWLKRACCSPNKRVRAKGRHLSAELDRLRREFQRVASWKPGSSL